MTHLSATLHKARRFLYDTLGISFIEFAFVLPLLLVFLLGGFEVTRYILIHQKIIKITDAAATIVAESPQLTNATFQDVIRTTPEMIRPFNPDEVNITVTQIRPPQGQTPFVVQQWPATGANSRIAPGGVGSTPDIAGLNLGDDIDIIVAEVTFRYNPIFTGNSVPLLAEDVYVRSIQRIRQANINQLPQNTGAVAAPVIPADAACPCCPPLPNHPNRRAVARHVPTAPAPGTPGANPEPNNAYWTFQEPQFNHHPSECRETNPPTNPTNPPVTNPPVTNPPVVTPATPLVPPPPAPPSPPPPPAPPPAPPPPAPPPPAPPPIPALPPAVFQGG